MMYQDQSTVLILEYQKRDLKLKTIIMQNNNKDGEWEISQHVV